MADNNEQGLLEWLQQKRPAFEQSMSMVTDPQIKAQFETDMAETIEKIKRGGLKAIKPRIASINFDGIKDLLVISAEKVKINGVVHERSGGWTLGQSIEKAVEQPWWTAGKDVTVDNFTTYFSPEDNMHRCFIGFACRG